MNYFLVGCLVGIVVVILREVDFKNLRSEKLPVTLEQSCLTCGLHYRIQAATVAELLALKDTTVLRHAETCTGRFT